MKNTTEESRDDFALYIKQMAKEKEERDISYKEAQEGVDNLVGFFDLLYKIDCRNKNIKSTN